MKLTPLEKKARAAERKAKRDVEKTSARIAMEKAQKPVESITISITWSKSRTWGSNPHAEACVAFKDGTFKRQDGFTCSGCGYDKESTVISKVFDAFLKYKLWSLTDEEIKGGHGSTDSGPAPYGICVYNPDYRHYGGGIGTSCYYNISEYIGGKFERIASGKMFDVYKYTDNNEE